LKAKRVKSSSPPLVQKSSHTEYIVERGLHTALSPEAEVMGCIYRCDHSCQSTPFQHKLLRSSPARTCLAVRRISCCFSFLRAQLLRETQKHSFSPAVQAFSSLWLGAQCYQLSVPHTTKRLSSRAQSAAGLCILLLMA